MSVHLNAQPESIVVTFVEAVAAGIDLLVEILDPIAGEKLHTDISTKKEAAREPVHDTITDPIKEHCWITRKDHQGRAHT